MPKFVMKASAWSDIGYRLISTLDSVPDDEWNEMSEEDKQAFIEELEFTAQDRVLEDVGWTIEVKEFDCS